jgi:outer membrane protein TolC
MKIIRIFLIVLTGAVALHAQQPTFSLEQAYQLARNNYPIAQQLPLLDETNRLQINNLNKNYLPTLELNAQATYQTQVTALPIELPGLDIPTISKDQYKATLDLRQNLWDGGITTRRKAIQNASTQVEKQRTEVELYNLQSRVNQFYFNVLLADEQLRLNEILQSNLKARIQKSQAAVANGTSTKANLNSLQAEQLNAEAQAIDIRASRRTAVQSLSLLLYGVENFLSEDIILKKPNEEAIIKMITPSSIKRIEITSEINRPELTLYQYQNYLLAAQSDLISTRNLPRVSAFATGGYGRPGLNFLDNDFTTYAILGASIRWNFSELYNGKSNNDRQLLTIQQQQVELQKQTFLLNTNTQLTQLQNDIARLQEVITKDRQQIALRESIRQTAEAQLDNGIVTSADFLIELNAENQARLNLTVHELQLQLAQANLRVTIGQ